MNHLEPTIGEHDGQSLLNRLGPGIGVDQARHLASVDSTNLVARAWARDSEPAELLVLADGQTAGRGRLGRTFLSPSGAGLWFTRVLRPPAGQPVPPAMTLVAGAAVCLALRQHGVAGAAVKWPNDILIEGQKVAGILAEASQDSEGRPFLVLGIGINLENQSFPPELASIATSIRLATGLHIERFGLLRAILLELDRIGRLLADEGFAAVRPIYLACSAMMGREVLLVDPAAAGANPAAATGAGVEVARCVDIDEDGALVLADADGRLFRRHAGEVSLRLPDRDRRQP